MSLMWEEKERNHKSLLCEINQCVVPLSCTKQRMKKKLNIIFLFNFIRNPVQKHEEIFITPIYIHFDPFLACSSLRI
jgi:hypothetical protein